MCANAVAAAEVVAALKGKPHAELPEELDEWIAAGKGALPPELPPLALKALEQIKTSSELQQLWEEAGDEKWKADVSAIEACLA